MLYELGWADQAGLCHWAKLTPCGKLDNDSACDALFQVSITFSGVVDEVVLLECSTIRQLGFYIIYNACTTETCVSELPQYVWIQIK